MQTLFRKCFLVVTLFVFVACSENGNNEVNAQTMTKLYITIAGQTQSITLANNAGPLGFSLPTSNQQMTAQPGDVVLYNGSNICLFYGSNSWSYTRLGKIDGLSEGQLRTFLKAGESNITVTLSLTSDATGISNISNESRNTAGTESRSYTLNGTPASAGHKGIVIKDGKKFTK